MSISVVTIHKNWCTWWYWFYLLQVGLWWKIFENGIDNVLRTFCFILCAHFGQVFLYRNNFSRLLFSFCRKLLLVLRKWRNQLSQKWLFVKAIWILKGLVSECCKNFRVYFVYQCLNGHLKGCKSLYRS